MDGKLKFEAPGKTAYGLVDCFGFWDQRKALALRKINTSQGAKEGAEEGEGFRQVYLLEEGMRGDDVFQDELFSYGGLGERVPSKHPLRRIREFADGALGKMSSEFEVLYSKIGRPSIPPEQLLRARMGRDQFYQEPRAATPRTSKTEPELTLAAATYNLTRMATLLA